MEVVGSSNTVHTLRESSNSNLNPTGSVQFIYAQLQMELAQSNKSAALDKIEGIRKSQAESAKITDAINSLRNLRQGLDKEDSKVKVTDSDNSADWNAAVKIMDKYGISHETKDDKVTRLSLDNMIASLEAAQEEVGADIQQEMVYIEDFMGQYNSYTQGASSAISSANETLKTVARGG